MSEETIQLQHPKTGKMVTVKLRDYIRHWEQILTKMETLGLDGLGMEEGELNFLRGCLAYVARRKEPASKGIAARAWAIIEEDLLSYYRGLLVVGN